MRTWIFAGFLSLFVVCCVSGDVDVDVASQPGTIIVVNENDPSATTTIVGDDVKESSRSWLWQLFVKINKDLLHSTLDLIKTTFLIVYAWPVCKFIYRWLRCRTVTIYEIDNYNKNPVFSWLESWCKEHPSLRNDSRVVGMLMNKTRADSQQHQQQILQQELNQPTSSSSSSSGIQRVNFGEVGATSMLFFPSILRGSVFQHSSTVQGTELVIKREIFRESHCPADLRESVLPSPLLLFLLDHSDNEDVRLFCETVIGNRQAKADFHSHKASLRRDEYLGNRTNYSNSNSSNNSGGLFWSGAGKANAERSWRRGGTGDGVSSFASNVFTFFRSSSIRSNNSSGGGAFLGRMQSDGYESVPIISSGGQGVGFSDGGMTRAMSNGSYSSAFAAAAANGLTDISRGRGAKGIIVRQVTRVMSQLLLPLLCIATALAVDLVPDQRALLILLFPSLISLFLVVSKGIQLVLAAGGGGAAGGWGGRDSPPFGSGGSSLAGGVGGVSDASASSSSSSSLFSVPPPLFFAAVVVACWTPLAFLLSHTSFVFPSFVSTIYSICVICIAVITAAKEKAPSSLFLVMFMLAGTFSYPASPFAPSSPPFALTTRVATLMGAALAHISLVKINVKRSGGFWSPPSLFQEICFASTQILWAIGVQETFLVPPLLVLLCALRYYSALPQQGGGSGSHALNRTLSKSHGERYSSMEGYEMWAEDHGAVAAAARAANLSRESSTYAAGNWAADEEEMGGGGARMGGNGGGGAVRTGSVSRSFSANRSTPDEEEGGDEENGEKAVDLSEWKNERADRPPILQILDTYSNAVQRGGAGRDLATALKIDLVRVDRMCEREAILGSLFFYDAQFDSEVDNMDIQRREMEQSMNGFINDDDGGATGQEVAGGWDIPVNVLTFKLPAWRRNLMREIIAEAHFTHEKTFARKVVTFKHGINPYTGRVDWSVREESDPLPLSSLVVDGHSCTHCSRSSSHRPHRTVSTLRGTADCPPWLAAVEDAKKFLSLRDSYLRRGISYQRSYLLWGDAGCGKSSFVKALAGEFRLPIYELDFREENFADGELMELMKDLDKNSNTVIVLLKHLDRAYSRSADWAIQHTTILNCVQGFLASDNRLLFITTNNRAELAKHRDSDYSDSDPALLRKGRISMEVPFGGASAEKARQLFMHIFAGGPNISGMSREELEDISDDFAAAVGNDRTLSFQPMVDFFCTRLSKPRKCVEEFSELEQLCQTTTTSAPIVRSAADRRGRVIFHRGGRRRVMRR